MLLPDVERVPADHRVPGQINRMPPPAGGISWRFTAQIKTHPHDQAAIDRQKIYLQALAAQGKVQVVHGFYGKHLKWSATYYKNIPRDLPARCQLPDAIPVGTHGNFIRRPEAWK